MTPARPWSPLSSVHGGRGGGADPGASMASPSLAAAGAGGWSGASKTATSSTAAALVVVILARPWRPIPQRLRALGDGRKGRARLLWYSILSTLYVGT